jgi:riboflavin kinase / FMN adenylyltransferase
VSMRIYNSLPEVEPAPPGGRVVAVGVFDGVHRGHERILHSAVYEATRVGAVSAAVTFYRHPEAVLRPRSAPRMLTSPQQKAVLLAGLGLDEMIVVRFDRAFAQLSPESFCSAVLSDHLGARVVFVGRNFRFGHGGAGTAADLAAYGATHGFTVRSMELVDESGETISSTRIRELLKKGRVREAARLLGRPFRVEGMVTRGAGRGRSLEAPTANLSPERDMALPRAGVYVTRSIVESNEVIPSVTSVGTNPTFESDRKMRIESLLLDYEGNLYGRHLALDFLERLRSQRRFPDQRSLAEQISDDVEQARAIHAEERAGEAGP